MQKTVLITGASSGIGKETAFYFHQKNYLVIGIGRNQSELEKTKSELKNFVFFIADFQEALSIEKCGKEVISFLKNESLLLSALINNAGIYMQTAPMQSDFANWKTQFQVNLFASIQLTELLIPFMSSPGSITNVTSTLANKPGALNGGYSASKAAMNSWTHSLAQRLAPNIRVNSVSPGIVETPIHRLDSYADKAKAVMEINQKQPMKRMGQPSDIAKSIYFLASEDSAWTTGSILLVDGGINLT